MSTIDDSDIASDIFASFDGKWITGTLLGMILDWMFVNSKSNDDWMKG
jgi:hypothetical protein